MTHVFASARRQENDHRFDPKRFGRFKCQPRRKESGVKDISARDESGSWDGGGGGLRGGRCEDINISPFLDAAAFLLCHSLSHTRRTNPLPYQPHPSQHRLNFPLQLLIKLFRTTTRGWVVKELRPPPNVVWGVLSRHTSPE